MIKEKGKVQIRERAQEGWPRTKEINQKIIRIVDLLRKDLRGLLEDSLP